MDVQKKDYMISEDGVFSPSGVPRFFSLFTQSAYRCIMAKKATNKQRFNMDGKTTIIETPSFPPTGHKIYSGFGLHEKDRRHQRRLRKLEEKRANRGDW